MDEIWEFNISTQRFKFLGKMRSIRQFHSTVVVKNFLYIIGGYDTGESQYLSHNEKFDFQKNLNGKIEDLNIKRSNFGICLSTNEKYFFIFLSF